MKRLTRLQVMRLSVASGVTVVAACGLPGGAPETPAILKTGGKLRLYATTNNVDEGSKYFKETVFARFQKQYPGVTIEGSFAPSADTMAKLAVETVAGTGPDMSTYDQTRTAALVQQGAIKNLTDLVKRDAKAVADLSSTWPLFNEPDGRTFSMPAVLTTACLLYNPELFDRFGVKRPDSTFSWNPRDGGSFLDAARKLTRPDQGLWGYWWTGQSTADTLSWLKQNDGSWIDSTRTKADMLKPASLDAFQWMHDLVHRYRVSPKPRDAPVVDASVTTRHGQFLGGKVAMFNFIVGQ